jgi:hypothetical protein
LATSSSRVAAKPCAMNSSIAAAMMASRRSAARSARFEAGFEGSTFAETFFGVLAAAALLTTRPWAGLDGGRVLVRVLLISHL